MEKHYPVPEEYIQSVRQAEDLFALMDGPRFKGYLTITARPAGSRAIISEDTYCMDRDAYSQQKLFDLFCVVLAKAKNLFGEKNFIIEIQNKKGDSLEQVRVNVSKKVESVIRLIAQAPVETPVREQKPLPPSVTEPSPAEEEIPATEKSPVSAQQEKPAEPRPAVIPEPAADPGLKTQPKPERPMEYRAPQQPEKPAISYRTWGDRPAKPKKMNGVDVRACPNPDALIDYDSMKYFPTERAPSNLRKVFLVCGIRTNRDILEALGTTEPTRLEWDGFIKRLRWKASRENAKLWDSSDGTLYWWLTKKMQWIKPFPPNNAK